MTEYVRFELEDGTPVLFETADTDLVRRHRGGDEAIEGGALRAKLLEAARSANAVSRALREQLTPDELSIELGLKVSGRAQWVIASAQTEGTIKVTLKWKHDTPPTTGDDPAPR